MSYINIIYREITVRVNEQDAPFNHLMGETADVLLSINSALDFTKIISTLYTGLPIEFFEHVTDSEMAPLP